MLLPSAHAIDSNVLLRSIEPTHKQYADAQRALLLLTQQGSTLHLFPQNVRELWNVATRPSSSNGLGLTIVEVEQVVQSIEASFTILADGLAVYHEWRRLVSQHQVSGVQVHDCYLAAAMRVHGIDRLLTFNRSDFARYGIVTVDPASI